jgi:ElaB/YqjD/DUF883 family membrane-anchored ribosome-binding protein
MDMTAATRGQIKDIKEKATDLLDQASEFGERFNRTADDVLKQSKRAIGRMQDSAEDALADTRQNIRRKPFESVAIAAAIGAGVGVLLGYLLASRDRD